MTRLTVPQLDANLVDVTVTGWHKQPGEPVTTGEPLVEITTDKAAFELEAPADGALLAILAETKSVVPAGYILALIGAPGETDATAAAENARLLAAYRDHPQGAAGGAPAPTAAPAAPAAPAGRIRATPRARRLAQQHGLDLARIQAESGAEVVTETVLAPYLPEGRA